MIGHISTNKHTQEITGVYRVIFSGFIFHSRLRSSSMGSVSKTATPESLLPSEKTLA